LVMTCLYLYLSWIETSLIAWVLDELFPPDQVKRWLYTPVSLLKLAILQDTKKVSYRTLVSTLSAEECLSIGLKEVSPGQFRIPCASTVHDFVRNRLSTDGFETLMLILGKMACKEIRGATGIMDSTPIPAAVHDSFDVHAYLWYKFKIIPLIAFRENAVINLEGTEMRRNGNEDKPLGEQTVERGRGCSRISP